MVNEENIIHQVVNQYPHYQLLHKKIKCRSLYMTAFSWVGMRILDWEWD